MLKACTRKKKRIVILGLFVVMKKTEQLMGGGGGKETLKWCDKNLTKRYCQPIRVARTFERGKKVKKGGGSVGPKQTRGLGGEKSSCEPTIAP